MAMVRLTKVRMLFVRCRGGVRHSPEESALDGDVWAAARKKGKRKEERERKNNVNTTLSLSISTENNKIMGGVSSS
uniref:Uncharacterized protein n=1 Tax=Oryza nivara TaxID=4536 RepID=A0A0E0HZ30_ORYNI